MEVELKQAMSGSQDGQGQGQITALQYYEFMLETCERLFDNQVEQFVFEDQMREMFGLHARLFFPCWHRLSTNMGAGCVQSLHNRQGTRLPHQTCTPSTSTLAAHLI
jgi:C-terminal domain of Sin3a protein